MFENTEAFSSFAVDDIDKAKQFYGETLGLKVSVLDEGAGLIQLELAGGRNVLVYHSPTHAAASFTILNFPADDVEATVDELTGRGIEFERYEGFEQDDKAIARGPGPNIAWFKDPSGNILSVLDQP